MGRQFTGDYSAKHLQQTRQVRSALPTPCTSMATGAATSWCEIHMAIKLLLYGQLSGRWSPWEIAWLDAWASDVGQWQLP